MENQNFKCSGNCLNCMPAQRAYCASQHSYSNMMVLDAMMKEVLSMKEGFKVLSEKIDAIQNTEAEVFAPDTIVKEEKAQEGVGAK